MQKTVSLRLLAAAMIVALAASPAVAKKNKGKGTQHSIQLELLGTYETGIFDEGAAEIVAYDEKSERLFQVNGDANTVDVLDISDPTSPVFAFEIDLSPYGEQGNSVAVSKGLVAVAVEADPATAPGSLVLFDTDGNYLNAVTVGALPDMVTFTPNGKTLLVANEGEPNDDYTIDPEGSVSIVKIKGKAEKLTQADVRTADFAAFNGGVPAGVRIFGPGATVAQDLEPEYIAVSDDGKTAWVICQENNALAVLDVEDAEVLAILPLGTKDHSAPGNALDPSDRDAGIVIGNWPVHGMYQPDAIAYAAIGGEGYLVSANEGDARDYDGFSEEERVKDLVLDPAAFPDLSIQDDDQLGRLTVTTTAGDTDNDGDYDELYAFGARSFSIWAADGTLVFDSGDQLEQITAAAFPANFNADNDENDFDSRSDAKGPEPEGVTVAKIKGETYAFLGLERIGGIVVFKISDPTAPELVQYLNNRDFAGDPELGTAGDLGPEGLLFITAHDSPISDALLVVANEVSGSTSIYRIEEIKIKP